MHLKAFSRRCHARHTTQLVCCPISIRNIILFCLCICLHTLANVKIALLHRRFFLLSRYGIPLLIFGRRKCIHLRHIRSPYSVAGLTITVRSRTLDNSHMLTRHRRYHVRPFLSLAYHHGTKSQFGSFAYACTTSLISRSSCPVVGQL